MIRRITLCLLLLSISAAASAGTPYVTGLYEPVEGGYRLYFTLHNALEDEAIRGWYVATEDAFDPFGPAEWTIWHTFRDVQWYTDPNRPWDRLPPGQSLGGFGYTAASEPSVLGYFIAGESHGYGGGNVTMVLIPEPSSLLVLLGAMGAVGLSLIRHRRRRN